ncbi:hypothetical protein QBZ16_000088 [Prototheca wickerhamii]|uniref:Uncharacterized protein n=1 Tax=Prototheca wickerhamii TaxID=3111 RepID=A0AAD9MLU3_PROWI|nr:hypothetical protein QBZ16_000088 [Prototheca wickerhamii]
MTNAMEGPSGSFFLEDLALARGYPPLPNRTYELDPSDVLDPAVFAQAVAAARLARAKQAVEDEVVPGKAGLQSLGFFRRVAESTVEEVDAPAEQATEAKTDPALVIKQEQEQETVRLQEVERRARERQAALEARAQQAREREAWSASVEALERELAAAESAAAAKERETEAHSARLETLKEEKHRLVLDLKRTCCGRWEPRTEEGEVVHSEPLRSPRWRPAGIEESPEAAAMLEGSGRAGPTGSGSARRRPSRWAEASEARSPPTGVVRPFGEQLSAERRAPSDAWAQGRRGWAGNGRRQPGGPPSPPRRYPSFEEREAMRQAQRAQQVEPGSPGRAERGGDAGRAPGSRHRFAGRPSSLERTQPSPPGPPAPFH